MEREVTIAEDLKNGKFILFKEQEDETETEIDNQEKEQMIELVEAGKVRIVKEGIQIMPETYYYQVTGGAVVHTVYSECTIPTRLDTVQPVEKYEKMMQEKTVVPNEIKSFPNPATDVVVIEMKYEGNYTLYMFDMAGKLVRQESFNSNQLRMDVRDNERGAYILKVMDQKNYETFDSKIVLMR